MPEAAKKPSSGPRKMQPQRTARREAQRVQDNRNEEQNRQKAKGGGQPNELGVTQGQNGEQGNSVDPRNAQSIGRSSH